MAASRFIVQRSHNDHELFPDAIYVIGAPAAGERLVMDHFDSRGLRRGGRLAGSLAMTYRRHAQLPRRIMTAYLVLMQQINDADRYRTEYLPGVAPFLKKHGAEILVAGFDAEPAEGEPPNSTVVLRFADAAAAWGFLNDPDYQPLREVRFGITSRGQAVIASEFTALP